MFFPLKYTGEVLINKTENFHFEQYLQNLKDTVQIGSNPLSAKVEQVFPLPWVNLSLRYTFKFDEDHAILNAQYIISLFELNVFFILCFGLSVFLFVAQIFALAILFSMLAFGYYWFALSKTSAGIKAILLQNLAPSNSMEEPGLWMKQQDWMKNEKVCPACGEAKNPYTSKCINCGVFHNKTAKHQSNKTTLTDSTSSIHYQFKKDKDA